MVSMCLPCSTNVAKSKLQTPQNNNFVLLVIFHLFKLTSLQDPVIFSGTLRDNLDPSGKYTDHDVWDALTLAHLKPFVETTAQGLMYECGENGESLR